MSKIAVIEASIEEINQKYGRIEAEDLVAEAKDESHPLHGEFTWDDTEAAALWRVEEARSLIRRVKVKTVTQMPGHPEPVVHSVRKYITKTKLGGQSGYVDEAVVRTDADQRKLFVLSMESEVKRMVKRYQDYEEFWKLVDDLRLPVELDEGAA
jgi:hypothetical protein